jgi:DNA-binding LytR/AlgR family response regulator
MLKSALVLIVEDDMVVRTTLETLLTNMGHKIAGFVDNAIDAMVIFNTKHPDIIIADINLNGPLDGIQLINKINEIRKVPVLFLTAHSTEDVFNKAKDVSPFAFIAKPIDRKNLERVISLAIENSAPSHVINQENKWGDEVIYTRVGHKLKKILIREIESIEVDGKYCSIHIGQKVITCKITLKELLQVLPARSFVQVARNHAVNLEKIDDLDMLNLQIKMPHGDVAISRSFKEHFFSRIQVI